MVLQRLAIGATAHIISAIRVDNKDRGTTGAARVRRARQRRRPAPKAGPRCW
jgi:hypothetical protein